MAVGPEFAISSVTEMVQDKSRMAADAEGDFVVVWESFSSDGDGYGIFGRRFSSGGTAIGENFVVNSYTTDIQVFPDIAMKPSGEFVVIWQSLGQDGDDFGIFTQRFDPDAQPVGSERMVHTSTAGEQHDASIALGAGGDFLVAWDHDTPFDHKILGRRLDSTGNPVAAELQLSAPPFEDELDPRVAGRADGSWAVTWERTAGDGSAKAVFARLLTAQGAAIGSEFQVNDFTPLDQEDPEIAAAPDGSLAITWETQREGAGNAVALRIFDSMGQALTGDLEVHSSTSGLSVNPAIVTSQDGGFVIVWESDPGGFFDDLQVLGKCFDSTGQALGGDFQVNDLGSGDQFYADITARPAGFIVTWTTNVCEGCQEEPKARVFELDLFADGFESGNVSAWSSSAP